MGIFDQDNRVRGPKRRSSILIALLIALVGLFMYWSKTEENPITGEKQHVSISPSQEIRLGMLSAPEMAAKMGGTIPDADPRAKEVEKIGNQIVNNSRAGKGPWRFEFHLLADPNTINAFALPGGQIFITLGLFNKLQTEGQLAGVLAHEIGHVIQRHAAQQMAKGQLGQILVMATGIGASDPSNPNLARSAAAIAAVVNQIAQLRYSRKDELEADSWGLDLMAETGYDPRAMLEVMNILKQASPGGKQPEMLLTHPYPEKRIEYIQEYLKKNPTEGLSEGGNLKEILSKTTPSIQEKEPSKENSSLFDFFELFEQK